MPGLKKEWKCYAHGFFESTEARCPYGCSVVAERAFLTAPGKLSKKSTNTDRLLNQLARDFGFSDMSNRKGSVGAGQLKGENPALWLEIPKGNTFRIDKQAEEQRAGAAGGASAAAQAFRTGPDASLTDLKLPPLKPVITDKRLIYGTKADVMAAIPKVA